MLQLSNSKIFGNKSYAGDLNMESGIVKSRVAFVLRSSEIKSLFDRFVTLWQVILLKKAFWFPFYSLFSLHLIRFCLWLRFFFFKKCIYYSKSYWRLVAQPLLPAMIRAINIKKFWHSLPKFIAQPPFFYVRKDVRINYASSNFCLHLYHMGITFFVN